MAEIAVPAGFGSRKLQDLPGVRQLFALAGVGLAIAAGMVAIHALHIWMIGRWAKARH